jgi:hypothetical protein
MTWLIEYQAPDGTWRLVATRPTPREACQAAKGYRRDQGHLAPETRVSLATAEQLRRDYGEPT